MSILNTFFLRYRADTGQAVKDVDKLTAAEEKENKVRQKAEADRKKSNAAMRNDLKKSEESIKQFGDSLTDLSTSGSNKFMALRGGASALADIVGSIGPAGLLAAAGVGAVIAAVAIANQGINDAREAAKEAITLGEQAFDSRLAQNELIRLQNVGRTRGLSDENVTASAKGVNSRGEEIRAAQRQAARDPASAFNNPLIKQANLWKKAGVDVAASLETQIEQQDVYLRALKERGLEERALVEGTQLFGRNLADVKSVLSTTAAQAKQNALALATENEIRRKLQGSSEDLATAEGKLDAERKKTDERIRSQTVPATKEFTEALTEWHRATAPLKDLWATFVSDLISGITKIVEAGTELARQLGWADETRTRDEQQAAAIKAAGDAADLTYINAPGRAPIGSAEDIAARAAARKQAEDATRSVLDRRNKKEDLAREVSAGPNTRQAVESLVKDGKFEGRQLSQQELAEATAKVEEAIKGDPSIDTLEEIKLILADQLNKVKEQGKVQQAQTEYVKKIEANTMALINTGLEQALSLWAANVGKGAGVASGAFQGETRDDYEKRVRLMQRTINPNVARQISMDRQAVGTMTNQADQINKAGVGVSNKSTSNSNKVDIKELNVTVSSQASDLTGIAQDVGVGIRDELKYAVADLSSPVVS